MTTLPADRTTANSANEHVSDHNVLVTAFNTQFWLLTPPQLEALSGTPDVGRLDSKVSSWLLDAASTESVTAQVEFPDDWDTVHVDLLWAPTVSAVGDVRLQALGLTFGDGEVPPAFTQLGIGTFTAPGTAFTAEVSRVVSNYAIIPGETLVLQLARLGADGADTYASDIGLIGVRLTKAS